MFQLVLLHSVSYFFFVHQSPSSSLCMVFDCISSNIDEVLLINPSTNALSLKTLMSIIRTDLPILLQLIDLVNSVNFSISKNLTQMVHFPTWILDYDSDSPALLDLFLSSDTSICSTMAFPPFGNSDHVAVSVSIDFLSHSQQNSLFNRIAYGYSQANWDGVCDN